MIPFKINVRVSQRVLCFFNAANHIPCWCLFWLKSLQCLPACFQGLFPWQVSNCLLRSVHIEMKAESYAPIVTFFFLFFFLLIRFLQSHPLPPPASINLTSNCGFYFSHSCSHFVRNISRFLYFFSVALNSMVSSSPLAANLIAYGSPFELGEYLVCG